MYWYTSRRQSSFKSNIVVELIAVFSVGGDSTAATFAFWSSIPSNLQFSLCDAIFFLHRLQTVLRVWYDAIRNYDCSIEKETNIANISMYMIENLFRFKMKLVHWFLEKEIIVAPQKSYLLALNLQKCSRYLKTKWISDNVQSQPNRMEFNFLQYNPFAQCISENPIDSNCRFSNSFMVIMRISQTASANGDTAWNSISSIFKQTAPYVRRAYSRWKRFSRF